MGEEVILLEALFIWDDVKPQTGSNVFSVP